MTNFIYTQHVYIMDSIYNLLDLYLLFNTYTIFNIDIYKLSVIKIKIK